MKDFRKRGCSPVPIGTEDALLAKGLTRGAAKRKPQLYPLVSRRFSNAAQVARPTALTAGYLQFRWV
jgi:hypothetical protein